MDKFVIKKSRLDPSDPGDIRPISTGGKKPALAAHDDSIGRSLYQVSRGYA